MTSSFHSMANSQEVQDMALIERLCQVDPDEPNGEPTERHIAISPFVGGIFSVLGGYHTLLELKNFYAMTAEDIAEMDVLITRITAYAVDSVPRMLAVQRVRSILTFWQQSGGRSPGDTGYIAGYSTVADIRGHFTTI